MRKQQGFDELLARWNDELLPWLIAQLGRKGVPFHDAEEASQKALVKLYCRGSDRPPLTSKELWLLKVARGEFLTECKRRNGEATKLEGRFRAGMERMVDHPSSDMEQSERQETVAEAMTRLTREEKKVVTWHFDRNWSFRQIARHLGISQTTARKRLAQSLTKLRAASSKAGIDGEL